MRVLTVRQPYAWDIVHAGKSPENRTSTIAGSYRGALAIHASLTLADDDAAGWEQPEHRAALAAAPANIRHRLDVRGAVIGVVTLVDVHLCDSMGCPGHEPSMTWPGSLCSPWAMRDHYHLVLADPRPLARPVPTTGRLGLWRPSDELAAAIAEQLEVRP